MAQIICSMIVSLETMESKAKVKVITSFKYSFQVTRKVKENIYTKNKVKENITMSLMQFRSEE